MNRGPIHPQLTDDPFQCSHTVRRTVPVCCAKPTALPLLATEAVQRQINRERINLLLRV